MKKFISWLEAKMPESMKLSPEHEKELADIREKANLRHNKAKNAAKKRGRKDFPEAPYESSWAYEMEFRRKKANTNEANLLTSIIRRVKGEEIPKNFRPDQYDAYERLRSSGVGHEDAIKIVQDAPVYHRISKDDKFRQDVESRWGR